jgi:outer membrane protein assembly factor BamB
MHELVEVPTGKMLWKRVLLRTAKKNGEDDSPIYPGLVISNDGRRLAALSADRSLLVLDVATGAPLWETRLNQDNRLGLESFDPTAATCSSTTRVA